MRAADVDERPVAVGRRTSRRSASRASSQSARPKSSWAWHHRCVLRKGDLRASAETMPHDETPWPVVCVAGGLAAEYCRSPPAKAPYVRGARWGRTNSRSPAPLPAGYDSRRRGCWSRSMRRLSWRCHRQILATVSVRGLMGTPSSSCGADHISLLACTRWATCRPAPELRRERPRAASRQTPLRRRSSSAASGFR